MSNVEAIKKAFAKFTTLNIDFTPDSYVSNAVISPTDGYRGTYFTVIGAGDQQNDVAKLFKLAVNSAPELLTTLEALQRENGELKQHVEELQEKIDPEKDCACSYDEAGAVCASHSPMLKAAKGEILRLETELVLSKPVYSRRQIEARVKSLEVALTAIVSSGDKPEYSIHDQQRNRYSKWAIDIARTALASTGGEHADN